MFLQILCSLVHSVSSAQRFSQGRSIAIFTKQQSHSVFSFLVQPRTVFSTTLLIGFEVEILSLSLDFIKLSEAVDPALGYASTRSIQNCQRILRSSLHVQCLQGYVFLNQYDCYEENDKYFLRYFCIPIIWLSMASPYRSIVPSLIFPYYKNLMGGGQSKQEEVVQISTDPLISRLRRTMKLQFHKQDVRLTYSFLHQSFSQQIVRSKDGKVDPCFSPFGSIILTDRKEKTLELVTCAFISPIMVLAPIGRIVDPSGFVKIEGVSVWGTLQDKKLEVGVAKVLPFPERKVALIVLEEPVWQLGWCGLCFLEENDQIGSLPLGRIFNLFTKTQSQITELGSDAAVEQRLQRVFCSQTGEYEGEMTKAGQQLVVRVINRKPYIIGVQAKQDCLFFSPKSIQNMQKIAKDYLSPERQKQTLKKIDLHKLQMLSSW